MILINDRDAFFENKTTCFVPKPHTSFMRKCLFLGAKVALSRG